MVVMNCEELSTSEEENAIQPEHGEENTSQIEGGEENGGHNQGNLYNFLY